MYISNNEESNSELDRIHKKLSDLYTEKQELNTKYKKLLGQKKQYKGIIFLCIVIIGCILGLFAFNKNLQSKDNKIQSQEVELNKRNDTIALQHSNIVELKDIQSELDVNIDCLEEELMQSNENLLKEKQEKEIIEDENSKFKKEIVRKDKLLRSRSRKISKLTAENNRLKNLDASFSKNSNL